MKKSVNINEIQLKNMLVKAISESAVVARNGKYDDKDLEKIVEGVIKHVKESNIDEGFLKDIGKASLVTGGVLNYNRY